MADKRELSSDPEEFKLREEKAEGWDHPIVSYLEACLAYDLMVICSEAVKKITESSYTEEAAKWAILNSSSFYGSQDVASNLADGALALLRRHREFSTPKRSAFDGFESLVDFTLLEMIHMLGEVRPELTVWEAMLCLLANHMNLSVALTAQAGHQAPDPEMLRHQVQKTYKGARMAKGALKSQVAAPSKNPSINSQSVERDEMGARKPEQTVPQNERDEMVLWIVSRKENLEKELSNLTVWANEKIMQAAQRLGRDRQELKTLRRDTETNESYDKRMLELENAVTNAGNDACLAYLEIRRLQQESLELKKQLKAARIAAFGSSNDLKQAVHSEQMRLKEMQSLGSDKGFLSEDLNAAKRKSAEVRARVQKATEREEQFEVLLKHEKKEVAKAKEQIEAIVHKKEEGRAAAKEVMGTAEAEKLKLKEKLSALEGKVAEMRLVSERTKAAALLNVGFGSSNFVQGSSSSRECVMCMSEEISVVFLPCAHQVLCDGCNVLLEERGVKDCPSCRTEIQRRISVSYGCARSDLPVF